MKLFAIAIILISSSFCVAQQYWVSALKTGIFDESHDAIKTSDGGLLSVGTFGSLLTKVIKFSSDGTIEWNINIPSADPEALLAIGVSVLEGKDNYFIAESTLGSDYISKIISIDYDGNLLEEHASFSQDINELMINSSGDLIAIYNTPIEAKTTIIQYDQNMEVVWEQDISSGRFPLLDSHAYIDSDDQIQLWLRSSNNPNEAIYFSIDVDGTISQQIFPFEHLGSNQGILHGKLPNNFVAYIGEGGNINGANPMIALADIENNEQIAKKNISEYFYWISDLAIIDDKIYILGQEKQNGIWSKVLVLDQDLNIDRVIELNDLLKEQLPDLIGSSLSEIKNDGEDNMLLCGHILDNQPNISIPSSFGYLNMYLNKNGTLDPLSSNTPIINKLSFNIYPNPCSRFIKLDIEDEIKKAELQIYNSIGALVFSKTNVEQNNLIDVDHLSKGMYRLSLINKGAIYTSSMVKQ